MGIRGDHFLFLTKGVVFAELLIYGSVESRERGEEALNP